MTGAIELYTGPRLTLPLGDSPLRFYGGLGPSLAHAIVDRDPGFGVGSVRASDWGLGVYGQLGVLYRVGADTSLGVEYRTLQLADMDFSGRGTDLDYDQLALVIGTAF